jgi:hypothetical protein
MKDQYYSATITVDKSPEGTLKAIQNLRGWWSKDIEGDTANVGDECTHRYKDVRHPADGVSTSLLHPPLPALQPPIALPIFSREAVSERPVIEESKQRREG